MDSEARRKRVAAQKQHSVLFLGRGLNLCSLSRTMRETTLHRSALFVGKGYITWIRKPVRIRVAAQKQHSVLFLGRGLNLCSLNRTMRETALHLSSLLLLRIHNVDSEARAHRCIFPFPNLTIATFKILCYNKLRRIRVRLIQSIKGGRYDDLLY